METTTAKEERKSLKGAFTKHRPNKHNNLIWFIQDKETNCRL